jgi:V8-like Glu-specific endopeptidase
MPRIQANRDSIDDRFSVLGFTVRTESPLFEVAVATDPALFRPENRGRRARANFYSSRAHGVTRARRGEAVYLVPPDVLSNFVGQPRLYFGMATYRENSRGKPDFVQAPSDGSMYVSMNQLTERGLRRSVTPLEGSSYAAGSAPGGRDPSLEWGGDAVAEAGATTAPVAATPATARAPAPAPLPPAPPMVAAAGAGYDDGFGAFPEEPAPLLAGGLELVRSYNGGLLEQLRFLAGSVAWFAGVSDTRSFPHSAICQVIDPAQGPEVERGTAFYIGRNLLLTAAHVVDGMSRLVFVPGKNGEGIDRAHEPFGRFAVNAAQIRKHESYRAGVRDFDFAIVKTPAEAPGGRWFNLLEELTQSRSEGVAVCGYSVRSRQSDLVSRLVNHTIDSRKQHLHGGAVRTVDAETFTYDIQTLPGASGSPVYWIEGTTPPRVHMVGVHVAGADDVTNKGCRLTTAKIGWIRARAAEWGQAGAMEVDDEALALDAEPVADTLALALAAPPRVRVRDRTRRPARFPTVRMLSAVERVAVSTLLAALNPAAAVLVRGLQLLPASHQLSVGVGPSVSAGFLVGAGVGAGLVFTSGGQIGVYGQFDLRAGLLDGASAELQVTLVQGGVEAFSGIGFAIGVEFDAGASISGQALFNTQAQFQGVSFGIGVGLGVEPLQIFLAMQAGASQALALCSDDAGATAALAAPAPPAPAAAEPVLLPAPAPVMQQPLAADDGDDTGAYPPAQAQAAPVVIPIVAAVVGAVFTRVLSNTGDVSWELDQMNGLKHPNDQAPANPAPFQDGPVIRLTDWPKTGGLGSIFAGFEVRWQHNGTSLGNISITNVSVSDAMAWGLVVKARIINDSIVYPRSAPRFAGLRIRFEYRFTHSVFSDRLAYREIQLFGNGAYNMTGDWTQHTFF